MARRLQVVGMWHAHLSMGGSNYWLGMQRCSCMAAEICSLVSCSVSDQLSCATPLPYAQPDDPLANCAAIGGVQQGIGVAHLPFSDRL